MSKKNTINIDIALNAESLKTLQSDIKEIKSKLAILAEGGDTYNVQNNSIIQLTQSIEVYSNALTQIEEATSSWDISEQFTELGDVTEFASAGMDTLKSSATVMEDIFGKNSQAAQAFNGALAAATKVQNMYNLARNAANMADKLGSVNIGKLASGLTGAAQATNTGTGMLGKFRGALIGTGIGAIIVALGAFIQHFDTIKIVISKVLDALGPFGAAIKNVIGIVSNAIEDIGQFFGIVPSDAEQEADRLNEIYKEYAAKREEQYNNLTKAADKEIELARARGEDTTQLEYKKNQTQKQFIEEQLAENQKFINKNDKNNAEYVAMQQKLNDELHKLNVEKLNLDREVREKAQKEADKKIAEDQKTVDKARKDAEEKARKQKEALDKLFKNNAEAFSLANYFNITEEEITKLFDELKKKAKDTSAVLRMYFGDKTNFLGLLNEAASNGIINIQEFIDKYDKYIAELNKKGEKAKGVTFDQFVKNIQDKANETFLTQQVKLEYNLNDAELEKISNSIENAANIKVDGNLRSGFIEPVLELKKRLEELGDNKSLDALSNQFLKYKELAKLTGEAAMSFEQWMEVQVKGAEDTKEANETLAERSAILADLNTKIIELTGTESDILADSRARELKALNDEYDEKAKLFVGNAEELNKLKENYEKLRVVITEKYAKQELDIIKNQADLAKTEAFNKEAAKLEASVNTNKLILDNDNQAFALRLEALKNFITAEQALLKLKLDQGLITEQEYKNQSIQLEQTHQDGKVALVTGAISQVNDYLNQASQTIAGIKEAEMANIEQLEQRGVINREEAEKRKAAINRKYALAQMAMEISKIVTATALALAKVWADTPSPAAPFITAIIAANAAVQLAKANSEYKKMKSQKLARGGLLNGPAHAKGGIPYYSPNGNIELEGGEAVINKRATAMYAPLLSAINQAGGGVAFAAGGVVPSYANGLVSNNIYQTQLSIDYTAIAKAVAALPPPVVAVEDINTATKNYTRIVERARF